MQTKIYESEQIRMQHKRAKEALNQSEKQFRMLVEGVKDYAIFMLDPNGYVISWNEGAEHIKGYTADEIIGQHFSCFYIGDDIKLGKPDQELKAAVADGRCEDENWRLRKDGSRFWASVIITAIRNEAGDLCGFSKVTRDMTERKQAEEAVWMSEERLALALEAASEGLWDWNILMGEVYFSPRYYIMLGYDPYELPCSYATWADLLHPDDREAAERRVREHIQKKRTTFEDEFRLKTKSGAWRWILSRGKVVAWDSSGRPVRMVGTHIDITERKQAENKLNQTMKQLKNSNVELEQFAYALSHDLKSPLMVIHYCAGTLLEELEDTLTGKQKRDLEHISLAVAKAEKLVEGLLNIAVIDKEKITYEKIDMGKFLRELIAVTDLTSDTEIIMADKWPTIEAEPMFLQQIFLNLITNSLKFNHSSPKIIDIGWQSQREDCYEFYVRDNGIGIGTRYHESIFKAFHRLHSAKEYEGTGIGLAIVKKATLKLHGSVRIDSGPGKGSVFFVSLPKKQIQDGCESGSDGVLPELRSKR